jgi:hypothetical protein
LSLITKNTLRGNLPLQETPFTKQEVKKAVFDSYLDGALGPDGISLMFYQKFWDLVKPDIMDMFSDFYDGKLEIFRLNFAVLSLIPKEPGATSMKNSGLLV